MGQNDAASYLTEANSITVDNDGLGDRVVGANDGAILASFTADVEFDVADSAQAIAAEVTGTIAPGTGAGSLDEADDVVASGGIVDAERCSSYYADIRVQHSWKQSSCEISDRCCFSDWCWFWRD